MSLILTVLLIFLWPFQENHSTWIECRVQAEVLEILNENESESQHLRIKIIFSEVTDGFAEIGSECFEQGREFDVSPELNDNTAEILVMKRDQISLRYSYYTSKTPNGETISITTWEYLDE